MTIFVYIEYVKPSLVPVRPHRPVDLRRTSSLADDAVEDDLKIPFGCLTLDKEIGSGAYGLIYHGIIDCEHQAKPVEVAVKILKGESELYLSPMHLDFTLTGLALLSTMHSPSTYAKCLET